MPVSAHPTMSCPFKSFSNLYASRVCHDAYACTRSNILSSSWLIYPDAFDTTLRYRLRYLRLVAYIQTSVGPFGAPNMTDYSSSHHPAVSFPSAHPRPWRRSLLPDPETIACCCLTASAASFSTALTSASTSSIKAPGDSNVFANPFPRGLPQLTNLHEVLWQRTAGYRRYPGNIYINRPALVQPTGKQAEAFSAAPFCNTGS